MNNQRSLVTEECGFIESHVVRLLQEKRDTVRILELPEVPEVSFACRVEVERGSISDIETVCKTLEGVHRVFHLASHPNFMGS